MDLGFSESEEMLRRSARDFLDIECPKSFVRAMEKDEAGYSPEMWQRMAELGWMGLIFPEEYGGGDSSFVDLILLVKEMGRTLLPGPFISTVVCGGLPILYYGNETQKKEFLPQIASGKLIVAPAFSKPDSLTVGIDMEDKAIMKDGKFVLSGTRLLVPYAHIANWLIFGTETAKGETLFLVDAKQSGVKCTVLPSLASDKQCEVILNEVEVAKGNILGVEGEGREMLNEIRQRAALAYSSFILGGLERVLEMTVEYAKQRMQFDAHIGSFQAIQHHCANMVMDIDGVRLLTYQAAWKLSQQLPATREISMAKARASDASRRVCLLGIKVHGGIGIMDDHDMQLYFRRAKAMEIAMGDGDFHRKIVATELGL
jgi:Acyl-CoA dehydrogenases